VENVDGILADPIDVHLAVGKLRRRYGWRVAAVEGRPRLPLGSLAIQLPPLPPAPHPGV